MSLLKSLAIDSLGPRWHPSLRVSVPGSFAFKILIRIAYALITGQRTCNLVFLQQKLRHHRDSNLHDSHLSPDLYGAYQEVLTGPIRGQGSGPLF